MGLNTDQFKEILSRYPTGVTIVTAKLDEKPYGLTVNAFAAVSLAPPLVLICIDKTAKSHDIIPEAKIFAVNILASSQDWLAQRFSDPALDHEARFLGLQLVQKRENAPLIEGCLGYLVCRLQQQHDGGDHSIFVGEVIDGDLRSQADPLLYVNRNYRALADLARRSAEMGR